MGSAPHLPAEDRAEFERVLDETLRNAQEQPDLATLGDRLDAAQLRTMALDSIALISRAAAAEYERYAEVRALPRASGSTGACRDAHPGGRADGPPGGGGDGGRVTDAGAPGRPGAGAGFLAVVTVLAPVLAATATLIFLFVGHLLGLLEPPPAFATSLIAAGWFFAALTAATLLAAAAGLLATALRDRAARIPSHAPGPASEPEPAPVPMPTDAPAAGLPDEIARAREAWRHALLERGIMPFLRSALADPGISAPGPSGPGPGAPGPGHRG
ncbi:hypothetical protein [Streptomyces yaizuensis]|uniref:ECF transporter S component n=1 Tax=Streptomyces yaizuensis TaxID=2989713 RepID=A0ABQ5P2F8_9ACTN|nr:hypothetical protein [Streptomyces sp. YSPA8]GLF96797.1 ECF transporter S component [Streptomyces sp. YSPA8]